MTSPRDWLISKLRIGGGLAQTALRVGAGDGGTFVPIVGTRSEWPDGPFTDSAGARQVDSDNQLTVQLRSWFAERSAYLIVEDDLALPDDPAVAERAEDTFVIGNDVYHYLQLDQQSLDGASDFVRRGASGYPTIAFVLSAFERPDTANSASDADTLNRMANTVLAALVSAYDDEGYLGWLSE